MTVSWPVPSLLPTTPRPLTLSSAWSPRLKKMRPSLSTRRTPLCYRSVALLKVNSVQTIPDIDSFMSCHYKGVFCWFVLPGCKSHSDSLHPQCHPLHWGDPGALPALCSAGLPSAERQPGGSHCVVRSRNVVTVQNNFTFW